MIVVVGPDRPPLLYQRTQGRLCRLSSVWVDSQARGSEVGFKPAGIGMMSMS